MCIVKDRTGCQVMLSLHTFRHLLLCWCWWYGFRLWARHFLSEAQPHFFFFFVFEQMSLDVFVCFFVSTFVCLLTRSFVHSFDDTLFSRFSSSASFRCSIICWFFIQLQQWEMQFSATKLKPNQLFSNKLEFVSEFDYGLLYKMWFV